MSEDRKWRLSPCLVFCVLVSKCCKVRHLLCGLRPNERGVEVKARVEEAAARNGLQGLSDGVLLVGGSCADQRRSQLENRVLGEESAIGKMLNQRVAFGSHVVFAF